MIAGTEPISLIPALSAVSPCHLQAELIVNPETFSESQCPLNLSLSRRRAKDDIAPDFLGHIVVEFGCLPHGSRCQTPGQYQGQKRESTKRKRTIFSDLVT